MTPSANVFQRAVQHVIVDAFTADAVTLHRNHSYEFLFCGLYVSSRTIICESVATDAGRFVIERFPENVQRAISKNLNEPAASVPAQSIYTRPERISNEDHATGVNDKSESSLIFGVVPAVFQMILLSSVFPVPPTPLSITRTMNHLQTRPLEASLFCGIDAPKVADGVNEEKDAPAAIVHLGHADGMKTLFAPAPNVHASHGEPTKDGQSLTVL